MSGRNDRNGTDGEVAQVVFYRQYSLRLRDSGWDIFDIVLHLLYTLYLVFRLNAHLKFEALKFDPTIRCLPRLPQPCLGGP